MNLHPPSRNLPILASAVWFGMIVLYGYLFLRGLPAYWQQLSTFSGFVLTYGFTGGWDSTAEFRTAMQASGLQPALYIGWTLLRDGMALLVYLGVGWIIYLRRRRELIGWYTSLMLVLFGLAYGSVISAPDYGAMESMIGFLIGVPWLIFYVFFYIFPDGRFVPGWTRFALIFVVLFIAYASFSASPDSSIGDTPWFTLAIPLTFGLSLAAQIYRYRRVSTPLQRQQTKWPLWALVVLAVGILMIGLVIPALAPAVRTHQPTRLVYDWVSSIVSGFSALLLPLGLGFSILRYRLWDIDILIRRTLQYSMISALLLGVYFGSVTVLQSILTALGGSQSTAATVISTLVIAALFNPLRRRVQAAVDRRFYRQKYDAELALGEFATTTRSGVDIHSLEEALIEVVGHTVQPERVVLWMRKP